MAKKIGHLLDEHGAEWDCAEDENGMLFFQQDMDGLVWSITLHRNGSIECGGRNLTPEQAVEVTLGRGECYSTTQDDAWCFACSACGKSFPRSELHLAHNHGEINYCPNCGRRVMGL